MLIFYFPTNNARHIPFIADNEELCNSRPGGSDAMLIVKRQRKVVKGSIIRVKIKISKDCTKLPSVLSWLRSVYFMDATCNLAVNEDRKNI